MAQKPFELVQMETRDVEYDTTKRQYLFGGLFELNFVIERPYARPYMSDNMSH
jgi:hypothetical protein